MLKAIIDKMPASAPAKAHLQRIITAEPKATAIGFSIWVSDSQETTEMMAVIVCGEKIRVASTLIEQIHDPSLIVNHITNAGIHARQDDGEMPKINPRDQWSWLCDDIAAIMTVINKLKAAGVSDGMPLVLAPAVWGPHDHVHAAISNMRFEGADFVKTVYNQSCRPPALAIGFSMHLDESNIQSINVYFYSLDGRGIICNSRGINPIPAVWRHIHCMAEQAGNITPVRDVITWIAAPNDIAIVREKAWPANNTWIFVH